MKRVVFIIRDGLDAKFICSKMRYASHEYEISYILESGKKARQKKIRRMLRKKKLFSAVMNMAALVLYDKVMQQRMKKIGGDYKYPANERYYRIVDVNDEDCLEICDNIRPDLILIYGTGILTHKTMQLLGEDIFNIHSSILPYYRNVHSDFWAYMNEDFDKIGITIFKLNEGIDTGYIADQITSKLGETAKLHEYKMKNLENIVILVDRFIENYFNGEVILKKQDDSINSVSQTPGTLDIIKFFGRK